MRCNRVASGSVLRSVILSSVIPVALADSSTIRDTTSLYCFPLPLGGGVGEAGGRIARNCGADPQGGPLGPRVRLRTLLARRIKRVHNRKSRPGGRLRTRGSALQ